MTAAAQGLPGGDAPAAVAGPEQLAYVEDAEPFDDATQTILATKVNPEVVEVRQPNDLLYVPWIHYQTILMQAFGPGGFRMVPKRPARQQGNVFTWEGSLWVRPRGSKKFQFVDEAVGECGIQSAGNGPEGAKSDCLTKCCKRLGIFMELFDPAWRRWWEGNYKAKHQAAKGKREWVERDRAGEHASPAPAPAGSSPRSRGGKGGSSAAPAEEPASAPLPPGSAGAATPDTGEAASEETLDALTAEIRRRKWTRNYAKVFFTENFGVETMSALTQQQVARALVLVMQRPASAAQAAP